jgi:hypothetical protein
MEELKNHVGKDTKGYKVVITNEIFGGTDTGASLHDPKLPHSFLRNNGTGKELGQTLAHEFAHVFTLGIKHVIDAAAGTRADDTGHSADNTNLMWPERRAAATKLTADQIAEIRKQFENKGGKVQEVDPNSGTQRQQTFRSWRRTAPDFNVVPGVGGLFNTGVVQGDLIEHPTGTLSLDVSYGSTGTGDQVQVRIGMNTDNNTLTGTNLGGSLNGIDKWVDVQIVGDPETTGIVSAQLFDSVLGPQGSIPLEFERIVRIHDNDTDPPFTTAIYDQINFNLEPVPQLNIPPIGAPTQIPIEVLSIDNMGALSDSFVYSIGWGDDQAEPDVFIETFTARRGESVDLTGIGFLPSMPGIIQLDDLEVATFMTGGLGDVASMFTVPFEALNGFYYVTASLDEVPVAIGGLSTFGFAMIQVVPEPATGTLLLLTFTLIGLKYRARRWRGKKREISGLGCSFS